MGGVELVDILLALLPIAVLLAFGYLLRRCGFPGDGFWPQLDRFVYYVLLPTLLFTNALGTEVNISQALPMASTTLIALIALAAALTLGRRFLTPDGASLSSVIQGAVRVNVYAGFAVAAALYGERGVALFSIVIAFAIPLDNILSISALNLFATGTRRSWGMLARRIALNPLLLSLAAGYLFRGMSLAMPAPLLGALELIAASSLPLALLAVGAGIRLDVAKASRRPLAIALAARQVVLPTLVLGLCLLTGVGGLERSIILLHAALPTGPAAYAVARQLGGDAPLMAAIITATTLFAVVSVPFWLSLPAP